MPDSAPLVLDLVDTHAGGDISRIVVGGVRTLPGETLLDQLNYLSEEADDLRRLLLYEPYGDPSMSINLVVQPANTEAVAGFITMESMGYPYFSGSNTLCTAATLMERMFGEQAGKEPVELTLETPDGLVKVQGERRDDATWSATCLGTPAYVVATDCTVQHPEAGEVNFHLVYSGALYVVVEAARYGLILDRENEETLIRFAYQLLEAARPHYTHDHPELGTLAPLPFVHFEGAVDRSDWSSRTATFVYPNVICRSPTGTGTAARLALLHKLGVRKVGDSLQTISPRGSSFLGRIVSEVEVGPYEGIRCSTTGRVFTLARSQVMINPLDPLLSHLSLRPICSR